MEPDDEKKKKLNDDVVVFMRKRSDTEAPRYTARLKTYVDFQQKRRRAVAARRGQSDQYNLKKTASGIRKKIDGDQKDKAEEEQENIGRDDDSCRSRRGGDKSIHRTRSYSRSRSDVGPSDKCCKRACCPPRRRRRKRPCCPRRRKRRRRSCRRRRRRSGCRRRRRRRSGCRRRKRRRSGCRRRKRHRSKCRRRKRRRSCG